MKRLFVFCPYVVLLAGLCSGPFAGAQSNPLLEKVLDEMDAAGKSFRATQASFDWDDYTSVVKEHLEQKGTIYFRRSGDETQVAIDIKTPHPKYLVLTGGILQIFDPRQDQVTMYNLQKSHPEFESFLVLGFGGGGHSLLKSFDVSYAGTDMIDGKETSKLDLVPKSPKAQQMFPHIVLWIDPDRGISVQQKLFQGEGDYRLAVYSDIQLKQKIPDSVFKLKTDTKTTFQKMSSD